MTYISRNYNFTRDRFGDTVVAVEFSEDELRALADGLGPRDGGYAELNAIADKLAKETA